MLNLEIRSYGHGGGVLYEDDPVIVRKLMRRLDKLNVSAWKAKMDALGGDPYAAQTARRYFAELETVYHRMIYLRTLGRFGINVDSIRERWRFALNRKKQMYLREVLLDKWFGNCVGRAILASELLSESRKAKDAEERKWMRKFARLIEGKLSLRETVQLLENRRKAGAQKLVISLISAQVQPVSLGVSDYELYLKDLVWRAVGLGSSERQWIKSCNRYTNGKVDVAVIEWNGEAAETAGAALRGVAETIGISCFESPQSAERSTILVGSADALDRILCDLSQYCLGRAS